LRHEIVGLFLEGFARLAVTGLAGRKAIHRARPPLEPLQGALRSGAPSAVILAGGEIAEGNQVGLHRLGVELGFPHAA
jgi:hypothetical protein